MQLGALLQNCCTWQLVTDNDVSTPPPLVIPFALFENPNSVHGPHGKHHLQMHPQKKALRFRRTSTHPQWVNRNHVQC